MGDATIIIRKYTGFDEIRRTSTVIGRATQRMSGWTRLRK
jgi:hypothetical protein